MDNGVMGRGFSHNTYLWTTVSWGGGVEYCTPSVNITFKAICYSTFTTGRGVEVTATTITGFCPEVHPIPYAVHYL